MKARGKVVPLWLLIVICLVAIGLIGFLIISNFGEKTWVSTLGYLVATSAIAIGGCIAYHHLRVIRGTERAAVLTNLDNCWASAELLRSRTKFRRFRNGLKNIKGSKKWQEESRNRLKSYGENKRYLYDELLNMVDFFETLGYFSKVGYILPRDAMELYGPGIKIYDKLFRQHIVDIQKREKDKSIYENFIWLANELNKQSD